MRRFLLLLKAGQGRSHDISWRTFYEKIRSKKPDGIALRKRNFSCVKSRTISLFVR